MFGHNIQFNLSYHLTVSLVNNLKQMYQSVYLQDTMNLIGKGGMSSRGTLLNVKNMFSHRTATPNDVMKSFNHCVDLLEVKYYTYILSCIMKKHYFTHAQTPKLQIYWQIYAVRYSLCLLLSAKIVCLISCFNPQ